MLPGCRHFSENSNSSGLFDSLYPELSTFSTSPGHDTDFRWSLVHHTIFDKILLVSGLSKHCWGIAWYFRWLIKSLYREHRRLILLKDFASNDRLTRSAKRGLKGANVQKNRVASRVAKSQLAVWLAIEERVFITCCWDESQAKLLEDWKSFFELFFA